MSIEFPFLFDGLVHIIKGAGEDFLDVLVKGGMLGRRRWGRGNPAGRSR
jgi:hypothetical protein